MGKIATIRVADGGLLKSQPSISLENVSGADFTRLLNVRRAKDQFVRREGWTVFAPIAGQPTAPQYVFDGTETLKRIAELIRGDGTKIEVGASLTKIKYFDVATAAWIQIGSGFSASGLPWQAVAISNVLVLNNGVDLPQTWEVGDAAVAPLYEAREGGIASAGRIAEYNGFLFLGDLVEVKGDQLAPWMNGYANHTVASTSAKAASFAIVYATDHRVEFDVTTGAGAIVVTLPTMGPFSQPFYVWIKKVDNGAGTVTTTPAVEDQVVSLTAINDIALLWWNGVRWVSRVFLAGVIPGLDPYGLVPDAIKQYIPDEQAWSELGFPENWAPILRSPMAAASATIYLPFKPFNWTAKQTRVAVIRGGPDGGVLGGQTAYPLGVLITAFAAFSPANFGVGMTIEVTTDATITYPRNVNTTRWGDISTFVGKQRLGNGAKITAMLALNGIQIISHEQGFAVNRYTAIASTPFTLKTDKYVGKNVPMAGDCIAIVNSKFMLYPTKSRNFFAFDGLSDPVIFPVMDDANDFFFTGLVDTDRIWAVNQPATQEVWFVRPNRVVAYCYDPDSIAVTEIDAQIDAAAVITKPAASVSQFALGIGGNVFVYSLVNGVATGWLRQSIAASGWVSRSASEANSWDAIAWSPSLALFAAVSTDGTNQVMTSPDGLTWTARSASEANQWDAIAWSPALAIFCAVSIDGTNRVMTSPDGITWTPRAASAASQWTGIAWSPSLALFVAVAQSGATKVMTSPDGVNWTSRVAPNAFWFGVTWGVGAAVFVAVGTLGANNVMTSPDGVNWTARVEACDGNIFSVVWSPELSLFAAVANTGATRIMTSPDGITWTGRSAPEANSWRSVAWSPALLLFVAVASNGTNRVMISFNGTSWIAIPAAEANTWMDLAWSPALGLFAAVSSNGTHRVMTWNGALGYTTPSAQLTSGLVYMGAQANEKLVVGFTPMLASPSPDVEISVQIRSTHNPSAALTDLLVPVEVLPSPENGNFIPMCFQNIFWQDEIILVDGRDVDFRLSGRIYEYTPVGGQGQITRSI